MPSTPLTLTLTPYRALSYAAPVFLVVMLKVTLPSATVASPAVMVMTGTAELSRRELVSRFRASIPGYVGHGSGRDEHGVGRGELQHGGRQGEVWPSISAA